MFSAALFLCAEHERNVSRQELQQLLLAANLTKSARSHNLRQLLYRLTSTGFPLRTRGLLVQSEAEVIEWDICALRRLTPEARAQLPLSVFSVLPDFSPSFSHSFEDWLDAFRTRTYRTLRHQLSSDLVALQRKSDWHLVELAARTLLTLDPLNYPAVKALVESALLRSDTSEALATIDRYLEDSDSDSPGHLRAQHLRRTISARQRSEDLAPFVGRADTLAALTDSWTSAAKGSTQYVLLTGPAGIGKTRVAMAIRELVAARGGQVIEHVCHETDRHQPLSLFVPLARELSRMPGSLGVSPAALSHIKRLLLDTAHSPLNTSDAIISEIARANLHDALVDLFDAVSSEGALLVLVDDAHLLDSASWAVLRALTARVRTRPMMLIVCTRSTAHIGSDASPLSYSRVIPLGPLSDLDSRALLLALTTARHIDDAHVSESVRAAGGNPFFLQAIARHPRWATSDGIPFDISALASRSYLSLDDEARTVLECVLLLKQLATIERVQALVPLDGFAFLRALRVLEEDGLLHCVGSEIKCPHDLLSEALQPLVPTTVVAVLRQRIAKQLEADCIQQRFDSTLAWGAAQAWMDVGNFASATRLLRRCAAYAASLAEHSEAARILARLLPLAVPHEEALVLIDELIGYSEAGGERAIRARALQERLRHMEQHAGLPSRRFHCEVSAVRVARAEADLNEVDDIAPVVSELRALIADEQLDAELRMRAGVSVLVAADLSLDSGLATQCWEALRPIARTLGAAHTQALRAELIFHTVFGVPSVAATTAQRILALHPVSKLDLASVISRRNALFALAILGEEEIFVPEAGAVFERMLAHKVYTEAVYISVTLADHLMALGDFSGALRSLDGASGALSRVADSAQSVTQGYLSSLSLIAAWCGEYQTARGILSRVQERLHLMITPRLRALNTAHMLKLALMCGDEVSEDNLTDLRTYYEVGARLGRQDTIVESLWLGYALVGAARNAEELLQEYLRSHRREACPVDWSLWHTTRHDPTWKERPSLIPRQRPNVALDIGRLRNLISRSAS